MNNITIWCNECKEYTQYYLNSVFDNINEINEEWKCSLCETIIYLVRDK